MPIRYLLISMHTKGSPLLEGQRENQMCGKGTRHYTTSLVSGYPDISVITYQTGGEISTFSGKKKKKRQILMAQANKQNNSVSYNNISAYKLMYITKTTTAGLSPT